MLANAWMDLWWTGAVSLCVLAMGSTAHGARYADMLGYYEPGQNVDVVYGSDPVEPYDNTLAALGGPGETVELSQGTLSEIVSLGGWSDDPATGTNDRDPGLVVGFSVEVLNTAGDDLLVAGNAPSAFKFYEPGFIEVAVESDGGGAKPDGYLDETFYLIRPGNYSQINDPRVAPTDITITTNPDFSLNYSVPFEDDTNLPGYFDVMPDGDLFDLADAVDLNGDPVALNSIAYVRLRSLSDSAFPFGSYIAPDVDYLEVLEIEGDWDGDGFVGLDDLDLILNGWNQVVPSGSLAHGDGDGDGYVGLDDLDLVLNNWNIGTEPEADAIPEPASVLTLFAAMGVGISNRSRKG